MIVQQGKLIELLATGEGGMGYVWLRGRWLIATDGFAMARVEVEREDEDLDGPIPPLALKLAREVVGKFGTVRLLARENTVTIPGVLGINRPKASEVSKVPEWDGVVKANEAALNDSVTLRLNAEFLRNLIEVLGCDRIEIDVPIRHLAAVRVRPLDSEGDTDAALLMPIQPQTRAEEAPAAQPQGYGHVAGADEAGDELQEPGEADEAEKAT